MAYTPTNWKKGDVVTSEKLNNIESATGAFYVNFDYDQSSQTWSVDKTLAEIGDALDAGKVVIGAIGTRHLLISEYEVEDGSLAYIEFKDVGLVVDELNHIIRENHYIIEGDDVESEVVEINVGHLIDDAING